jgi:glycyl-tRNA synthetase
MNKIATSRPATPPPTDPALFDKIVNLSARRGFVYPSASIYGGFKSAYDYGPLGVLLLRNVKNEWWRSMVQQREDIVGIDASILSPPAVWEASGHLANFSDPLVDCRNCQQRFRLDKLEDPDTCPNCASVRSFTDARAFNLMFKTHAGPVEGAGHEVYLRPETAQGMFINFQNVLNTTRVKPPFGIAQVGKSFRNEITPGNFVFRTREFEQMEMEYFVPPNVSQHWYEYWCGERLSWYADLGIPADLLRLRAHTPDELSHYSSGTSDVEFLFPWGWDELEGIANRGDYDLSQHAAHSGQRLEYFDSATHERYVPHVIEPAAGATRTMMAFLMASYREEEVRGETRTVLQLDPRLAPFKAAVLPLRRKAELVDSAKELARELRGSFMCDYDETASIGKRYRRQDEIGTPLCITVDPDALTDGHVTIRDRDTMEQTRVPRVDVEARLHELLKRKQAFATTSGVAA